MFVLNFNVFLDACLGPVQNLAGEHVDEARRTALRIKSFRRMIIRRTAVRCMIEYMAADRRQAIAFLKQPEYSFLEMGFLLIVSSQEITRWHSCKDQRSVGAAHLYDILLRMFRC